MLKKDLNQFKEKFTEYTELRVQENRTANITIVNGDVSNNNSSVKSGISVRVFKNDNWGFASSPIISDEEIEKVILSATENVNFMCTKQNNVNSVFQKRVHKAENSFYTREKIKEDTEKIAFLKKIDVYICEKYPDLLSRSISLFEDETIKNLVTSEGSESYSMIPKTIIGIGMKKQTNGENFKLDKKWGGKGQFEDLFKNPENLFEDIDKCYNNLIEKTNGIFAESGIADVILGPNLVGVLAHEAIGHTTEGDMVLGGSIAADYLNKKIASPLITLTDFAHTYNGETCPVPIYIDDEGVKAEDQIIIENGVLKGYMHNKETAFLLKQNITGNAIASEFSDEPLVRMRNTAILPGTSKLSDMIASIEKGYYLVQKSNGQSDLTGEFMNGVTFGYEIINGKIGRAIKDTTISGIAFDVLKSVTMVSDDMIWDCDGMCGKKQVIHLGMGGPAIKCRVNIGGK